MQLAELTSPNDMSRENLREKLTAWDAKEDPKASLTDTQKDGFMELTSQSSHRPLPIEVVIL